MFNLPPEIISLAKYAAPPILGAFIGYLTNHVAIKMLFRPLKPWKIGGIRVPMTPGVIPSKRVDLAKNMGEVVGDHLLTSKEIGKGLQNEAFQLHLLQLIKDKIEGILQQDLGTLASIVPAKFRVYFDIGSKTLIYQIKDKLRGFINSDEFVEIAENSIERRIEQYLASEIGTIVSGSQREMAYGFIEKNIARMFMSEAMEQWAEDFVHQQVYSILHQEKSLTDILPGSLLLMLQDTIERQTPALLSRLATIVSEPEVRDSIVKGGCAGVESFIGSMGSMADMVRGFVRMETVEGKIREYLIEKDDDIVAWLKSEEVQAKVVHILRERSGEFLRKPIVHFIKADDQRVVEEFCDRCAQQMMLVLRGKDISVLLTSMIKSNLEDHFESGSTSLHQVCEMLLGKESLSGKKTWLKQELCSILQSPETFNTIESLIDSMAVALLQKKIGKMAHIIPVGVREGMARSLQKTTSAMLAAEVPGLVQSLNIKNIVTEKVNSLDILKLEGLLLSIMQEQFKYINLFGALLGFIIGCGNLLILF
ncbi:MAG: DUF445 family protein [Proteobacteria bacterium]|nr:DUF445 family protein [Pseudomonadota bacterium]